MLLKGLSLIFLGFGVFVLMQVLLPFLSFKAWETTEALANTELINPISSELESAVHIEDFGSFPAFVSTSKSSDLPYKEFKLTVPRLKLDSEKVMVSSNDFEQNLAQLPGSSLPGEKGNIFISGHSSLPNTLIKQKIKPIFVNLPNLKKGDEIKLEALGQVFLYEVQSLKVVNPKDVSVINPPDPRGRYLTLMTCVPPGFNTKRLVVLAKLK